MKKIRNLTILVGLCLVLVTLGANRTDAQVLSTTTFTGTLTLPYQVQWGEMTLPAGDYVVQYGTAGLGGLQMVEVTGIAKGSPHGFARVISKHSTKADESTLTCIHDGNAVIVSAMEIPATGQTVKFRLPRSAQLLARRLDRSNKFRIAERQKAIERIPVKLNHQ